MPWPFIALICILVIAAVVHFGLPSGRSRPTNDVSVDTYLRHDIFRDDDHYWTGSFGNLLYNNPDDPDLFVPKRYGFGWTVNLGHRMGKPVLLATFLVPLVLALLGTVTHH